MELRCTALRPIPNLTPRRSDQRYLDPAKVRVSIRTLPNPAYVGVPITLVLKPKERSTAMDEGEVQRLIENHLKDFQLRLFGAEREPREALAHGDKAQELAKRISGKRGVFWSELFEVLRHFAHGYVSFGKGGDLKAALRQLIEARKLIRTLKENYPEFTDELWFRGFELGIEGLIIDAQIPGAEGNTREELTARRDHIMKQMADLQGSDDPVYAGLKALQEALPLFRESYQALAKLNLDDATHYSNRAKELMFKWQESFSYPNESLPFILHGGVYLFQGFGEMVAAQASYVRTLHDAIVGEVRDSHLVGLEEADRQLRHGKALIEKAMPILMAQVGEKISSEFSLEPMKEAVEVQREIIRNLRSLIKESLKPEEIARRSSPRFLVYFALTFVVVLFSSRWSGLVVGFGGREIVYVLLISSRFAQIWR
jgi:hypothetical protein